MIKLNAVCKTFDHGETFAVKDVSLEIQKGEILILLGSSGSGKSTLLKLINRLVELSSGRIEIDDVNIADIDYVTLRRSIGYVFQGVGLFPHMTVAENVSIVLRLLKKPLSFRKKRARELLELVHLDPNEYADRYPDELSGGQRQRVGVVRALAADQEYLLMDEPFGALDAITRDDLQAELLHLNQSLNKTIVFVTHDIFEAMRLGDRIAVMHQGMLQQVGTKQELLNNPASEFVRELFAKTTDQISIFVDEQE